jgi:uracil-DNA glycosylase
MKEKILYKANGLAFSVPRGIPIPRSLKNILIELKNDIPDVEIDKNMGGCLESWAKQGVFLLNTTLTVEYNEELLMFEIKNEN